jgi:hypothetical protein
MIMRHIDIRPFAGRTINILCPRAASLAAAAGRLSIRKAAFH